MAVQHKNPLAQAVGLYIRQLRQENNWDFETAKNLSGISKSYFKSVESGTFTLHVSKSFTLYNLFSNQAVDTAGIPSLDAWTYLLSTITTIDTNTTEAISFKAYLAIVRENVEHLSAASQVVEKLMTPFLYYKIFNCTDSKEVERQITTTGLVAHIQNFAVNFYKYLLPANDVQQKQVSSFGNDFLEIPSLYLDFAGGTINRLKSLPVTCHYSDLINWERQNNQRFEDIYTIINNSFDPSNEDDYKEFNYSYITYAHFRSMKYFFVEANRPVKDIEKKAKHYLVKHSAADEKEKMKKSTFKISVECLIGASSDDIKKLFNPANPLYERLLDDGKYEEYDIFWLYRLRDSGYVGFVAKETKSENNKLSVDSVRNLTVGEIEKFLRLDTLSSHLK